MNTSHRLITVTFILAALNASATTHYVSPQSTNPTPPYSTWATAATNIQQAVNAAATSDEVVVTNGVYGSVQMSVALNVRSVNGPQFTVINGGSTNRCVSLPMFGSLTGFTVTNGYLSYFDGGGVWCSSTNGALLTNCTLIGNSAYSGGGASGATLYNCTLTGNAAQQGGGAFYCVAYNCSITSNSAEQAGGAGDCWLYNCTVSSNYSVIGAGGVGGSQLHNCTVSGNSAVGTNSSGGGALGSQLYNCTVTDNSAGYAGGGSSAGTLDNCTLVGNSATYGGGSSGDEYVINTIIYFNTALYGGNYDPSYINVYIYNSCTTPMPPAEGGNITNAPLFIDYAGGNLRLQSSSPCINAGNNTYAAGTTDLDGRPRIVGGTVDMGAYEFQPSITGAFIGWLQQYGLPTDGSADFTDPDGDGMNNWQEWICGTDPTNVASVLIMLNPTAGTSGAVVSWLSVTNRSYFLQRAASLAAQPSFSTVATNIPGQLGTTSFTDTNGVGGEPFFYRVGVHQ